MEMLAARHAVLVFTLECLSTAYLNPLDSLSLQPGHIHVFTRRHRWSLRLRGGAKNYKHRADDPDFVATAPILDLLTDGDYSKKMEFAKKNLKKIIETPVQFCIDPSYLDGTSSHFTCSIRGKRGKKDDKSLKYVPEVEGEGEEEEEEEGEEEGEGGKGGEAKEQNSDEFDGFGVLKKIEMTEFRNVTYAILDNKYEEVVSFDFHPSC